MRGADVGCWVLGAGFWVSWKMGACHGQAGGFVPLKHFDAASKGEVEPLS